MNEAQEQIKEENSQEENIIVDIDETSEKKEDVVEAQQDNTERTDVRSEDQEEELENYSENVQKRINQLTAKRKLALEEAGTRSSKRSPSEADPSKTRVRSKTTKLA